MTAAGRAALTRAVGLVLGIVVLFSLIQEPFRLLEARLLGAMLRALPRTGEVVVVGPSVVVFPEGEVYIRAVLLPSCSSLAPVLAMAVLWPLAPRGQRLRRGVRAVGLAAVVIAVGNLLRLLLSLLAGRWFGVGALVAFHDSVGAAFSYVYVIVGLLVGLRTLLAPSPPDPATSPVPAVAPKLVEVS